jgi:hypothetical protein
MVRLSKHGKSEVIGKDILAVAPLIFGGLDKIEKLDIRARRINSFGELVLLAEGSIILFGSAKFATLAQLNWRLMGFADSSRTVDYFVHHRYGRDCTHAHLDAQEMIDAVRFQSNDFVLYVLAGGALSDLQFGNESDPALDARMFDHLCSQLGIDPQAKDAAEQRQSKLRAIHLRSACHHLGVDFDVVDRDERLRERALLAQQGLIGYNSRERRVVDL